MNYEEKKTELEARFKPVSAAAKLAYWLEENPDEAPKAAKKAAKKVEPVEEAEE
jgi:hypothetical protein